MHGRSEEERTCSEVDEARGREEARGSEEAGSSEEGRVRDSDEGRGEEGRNAEARGEEDGSRSWRSAEASPRLRHLVRERLSPLREKGREEGIIQTAKEMIKKNFPLDLIHDVTKLAIEKIEELMRNRD